MDDSICVAIPFGKKVPKYGSAKNTTIRDSSLYTII